MPRGLKPRPLFFLHIPKTAGTSLGALLKGVYGPQNAVLHLEHAGLFPGGLQGIGVSFLELSQDQQEIIRAFITNN